MKLRPIDPNAPVHHRWDRNESGEVFWGYQRRRNREVWVSEAEAVQLSAKLRQYQRDQYHRIEGERRTQFLDQRNEVERARCRKRHMKEAVKTADFRASTISVRGIPSEFLHHLARGRDDGDIAVRIGVRVSKVIAWRAAVSAQTS